MIYMPLSAADNQKWRLAAATMTTKEEEQTATSCGVCYLGTNVFVIA
jgi:hypothetical protein